MTMKPQIDDLTRYEVVRAEPCTGQMRKLAEGIQDKKSSLRAFQTFTVQWIPYGVK